MLSKRLNKFRWLSVVIVLLMLAALVSPARAMFINDGSGAYWEVEHQTTHSKSSASHQANHEATRGQAGAAAPSAQAAPATPVAVVVDSSNQSPSPAKARPIKVQTAPAPKPAAATNALPAPATAPTVAVTETEHSAEVSFKGSIQSINGATLIVDGHTVLTDTQTVIQGTLAVGAYVEVEGFLQVDQSVLATQITVDHPEGENVGEVEFRGPIVSFPASPYQGTWVVGNYTLIADSSTTIDTSKALPAVGAIAEVKATQRSDGTLLASLIKIEDSNEFENEVEFKGTVSNLTGAPGAYDMLVDQRHVTTDNKTQIIGTLANGAFVEVRGSAQPDGSVLATQIQVDDQGAPPTEKEFRSTITALPVGFIGAWTFANGETVQANASTVVDESRGPAQVGALAEVKAIKQGAQWVAVSIQIENN